MKKWERIAASVFVLIGIGAALGAVQIGFGSFRAPGPGFFPFWLAVGLAVVSLVYFLSHWGADSKVSLWFKGAWVRPSLAAAIMLVYGFFMKWLGFCVSTLLLFIVWMTVIGREKWLTVILVSILGTAATYCLFAIFLKVPLPTGILF